MKKVAIIIPTYNGERFIKKTIISCLSQTYENIDIFAFDDFSKDNTLELLTGFEDEIYIFKNSKNLGLVKTINIALQKVEGYNFVVFLGHDDVLPENHIKLLVNEFDNDEVIAIHCNSILIDENDKELGLVRNDNKQVKKSDNCLFELSLDNFINSCGMMHRLDILKKIGGLDDSFRNYGEWLLYIKELEYGSIKYTMVSKSYYRRHETNISNTFKNKETRKSLNMYKKYCRDLAHHNNKNSFHEDILFYLNKFKLKVKSVIYG